MVTTTSSRHLIPSHQASRGGKKCMRTRALVLQHTESFLEFQILMFLRPGQRTVSCRLEACAASFQRVHSMKLLQRLRSVLTSHGMVVLYCRGAG
jgi:hypothetical protein